MTWRDAPFPFASGVHTAMAAEASGRVVLFAVENHPNCDAALTWYMENVFRAGDFIQLLHVVDKSEKFIDEMLHTDIRLKCAAINDPAVDFIFDRFEPRLKAAGVEHRINVLRCSQAARTVGDVVVTNAARIKASLVLLAMKPKNLLKELVMGSCANHVVHRAPCPVLVVRGTCAPAQPAGQPAADVGMEAADVNT